MAANLDAELDELRGGLEINRDRLDEELIRQPQLFYQASELFARAVDARETAKDQLKQVAAEVYLQIRRDRDQGDKKYTEAMVQAEVESSALYVKMRVRHTNTVANAERAEALKDAYSQRGYMLRELCGLYTSGYFAKNSVESSAARDVKDAGYERVRADMSRRRKAAMERS